MAKIHHNKSHWVELLQKKVGAGEGEKGQGFERSVNHVDWHFVKKMKDGGMFSMELTYEPL
jgi:hypothetical protein